MQSLSIVSSDSMATKSQPILTIFSFKIIENTIYLEIFLVSSQYCIDIEMKKYYNEVLYCITCFFMDHTLLPVYDFDGNILSPQTVNFFQDTVTWEIIEVLVHEVDQNPWLYFASGKYRFSDNDPEETFQRFHDYYPHDTHPGPDGLMQDTKQAIIEGVFSPSFENFKQLALIDAEMFAILTARGHWSDNIQRAISLIAEEVLTSDEKKQQIENIKEKYSALLKEKNVSDHKIQQRFFSHIPTYMWISNINLCKNIWVDRHEKSWIKKSQAIDVHYNRAYHILGYEERFAKWFSDDGELNIIPMAEKFLSEKRKRPQDKYRLYFTGKHEKRDQVKQDIMSLDWWSVVDFVDEEDILKIRISR